MTTPTLREAAKPFADLFDAREAAYKKRGGDLAVFGDAHPAFDIKAEDLPLGVWRALRLALTAPEQSPADGGQAEFLAFTAKHAGYTPAAPTSGEPVATLHDDGCFTWKRDEFRRLYDRQRAGWRMDVYATPPSAAQAEGAKWVVHQIAGDLKGTIVHGEFDTEEEADAAAAFLGSYWAGTDRPALTAAPEKLAPAPQQAGRADDAFLRGIQEGLSMAKEIDAVEAKMKNPPCVECGAMTQDEAATKCHCSGDKDDCHGCQLWPDDASASASPLEALLSEVRKLPTVRASEIDGEESDGTPRHWRNRPFVSLRQLERLLRERATPPSPQQAAQGDPFSFEQFCKRHGLDPNKMESHGGMWARVALEEARAAQGGREGWVEAPFSSRQRRNLWNNSPELHKDAASFAGFERIVTLVEQAHYIGITTPAGDSAASQGGSGGGA